MLSEIILILGGICLLGALVLTAAGLRCIASGRRGR